MHPKMQKGYQFVNWFPRVGFWFTYMAGNWAYIWDWRWRFLFWEVRKWSTIRPGTVPLRRRSWLGR